MALLSAPGSSAGLLQYAPRLILRNALCFQCQFHSNSQSGSQFHKTAIPRSQQLRRGAVRWYSSDKPSDWNSTTSTSTSSTLSPSEELQKRLEAELRNNSDLSHRLTSLKLGEKKPSPAKPNPKDDDSLISISPELESHWTLEDDLESAVKEKSSQADLDDIPPPGSPFHTPPTHKVAPSTSSSSIHLDRIRKTISSGPLPSEIERLRWTLSKKFSSFMDRLQEKLVIWSQQVNKYTGTDYSAINALREGIKDAEKSVRVRIVAVTESKASLDNAHTRQASSQKEVVGLLERKHSWSATDLEKYMALIRSEHVNEQAIQTAKESVLQAERSLEEARIGLEKKERLQYHEEQVWSDTIRRNSTWVTIVLMGLNVLLLLSNVFAIEPWRRKRLVREIQSSLDDNLALTLEATREGVSRMNIGSSTTAASSNVATEGVTLKGEYAQEKTQPGVSGAVTQVTSANSSGAVISPPQIGEASNGFLAEAEVDIGMSPCLPTIDPSLGTEWFGQGEEGQQEYTDNSITTTVPELLRNIPSLPIWMQTYLNEKVLKSIERGVFGIFWFANHFFARDRVLTRRPIDQSLVALEGVASGAVLMMVLMFFVARR